MRHLIVFFIIFSLAGIADDDMYEYGHYYSKDMNYLNLTKRQKNSIKKLLKEYRNDLKKLRKEKKRAIKEKKRLFLKDSIDTNKLYSINLHLNKMASHIEEKFLEDLHTILTKKQRKKFVVYLDEWEIE